MIKLYSYFRSSASYRVRIALHWKRLDFEYVPVHLLKDGGQQNQTEYRKINPMGHVPALYHDGFLLAESMAMIQYLDRVFPQNPLFPQEPQEFARNLQICEHINSGIQPLQNIKVAQYLDRQYNLPKDQIDGWTRHWIEKGLESLEKVLEPIAGNFCMGNQFSAADCFLMPQCFSSRRFGVKIEDFPIVSRIEKEGLKLEAVQKAHPEKQPDFAK